MENMKTVDTNIILRQAPPLLTFSGGFLFFVSLL
jgi:hypothetical protein